jgi:hypothetical protein
MQEKIFRPRYPAKLFWGFSLIIALEFFILAQILSGKGISPATISMATIFGLFVAIMPYALIKRIVFGAHAYSIEKYFWPAKTIEYADVLDVDRAMIKTRRGDLAFRSMANSDELHDILTGLIEQGKISRHQLEDKVVAQETIGQKALLPSGVLSFVLWAITLLIWPPEDMFLRKLSILGFLIPVYFVVYQFLKNRMPHP